jgi:hypothetical protein
VGNANVAVDLDFFLRRERARTGLGR